VSGFFCCLGVDDALPRLQAFAERYLGFLGPELAAALAAEVEVADADRLRRTLAEAEAAGCDEVVLVPATADPACLDALAEVVGQRR
jgi:hypothetical protein